MTRSEFEKVIAFGAFSSTGHIDEIEFTIMQSEAFADSKNNVIYAKMLAFLTKDAKPFYCNSVDELFQKFIVNGKPFGEQLDRVKDFNPDACFD